MITYDTLSPPHTNYSATPPTQTTLSGWVLAPRRENTLLDGNKGDMEHHTNSHEKFTQADAHHLKEQHSDGRNTTIGANYITNTGIATGVTTVDIDNTHQTIRGHNHQGASRNNPSPLLSKQKVKQANMDSTPSKSLKATYGATTEGVISFEHINVNGINPHSDFVELTHVMGSLEAMGASVYSINETKWDTTCPTFCKYIKHTIKKKDQYAKVAFSSNEEEIFDGNWKPGGTLLGVSGVWASRVEKSGTDPLGRWSWAVLRGKKGR